MSPSSSSSSSSPLFIFLLFALLFVAALPDFSMAAATAAKGKKGSSKSKLPKGPTPCPSGCRCHLGHGGDDCGVMVECRKISAFPASSDYPEDTDCVFLNAPKLGGLSDDAKAKGLAAIPATVRRLDLSESSLGKIPEAGFGHLPALRVLNLEFNKLVTLPEAAFHGLSKLKVLWLTGNHYQPDEKEYKRMKKAGNNLKELHPNQFQGLESLQVLLMHHNQLTSLPDGLFSELKKLRVLKLLDNPFSPPLSRSHPAFEGLLAENKKTRALQQLDLVDDSGDSLEDYWESHRSYLSDDFKPGKLPGRKTSHEEL